MKQYSPLEVANTFIQKFGASGDIDHLKLQKLVYCAYGWWLVEKEYPLTAEAPQIWKHGPVFNSLYHALSLHGAKPITRPQSITWSADPSLIPENEEASKLIDWVWQRYGHQTGGELSNLTHRPGTAWHKMAQENNFIIRKSTPIKADYVKAEFLKVLQDEQPIKQAG